MASALWLGVAVIYASKAGEAGAAKIAEALRGAGVPAAVFNYDALDAIWGCYDAYVFVMAAGGVVRALCKRLEDKARDPPVVVASHDLRRFVPLVGAHRGANELAARLAHMLGGEVVITTASERLGFAPVEDLERALLCSLSREDELEVYRRLIAGEEVCVDAPVDMPGYRRGLGCGVTIRVGCDGKFCCRRWRIYAGFGASSKASPHDVVRAIRRALADVGAEAVEAVASVKDLVYEVASLLGARAVKLEPSRLVRDRCLSPPFRLAEERLGVGNVAEAAALTAAGPGGKLIYRKRAYEGSVTVAFAANE